MARVLLLCVQPFWPQRMSSRNAAADAPSVYEARCDNDVPVSTNPEILQRGDLSGSHQGATSKTEIGRKPLRLLIADDHEIFRIGLRNLLETHSDWSVVAEAADGREAIQKAKMAKPRVIVLDTGMPTLNGLDAARQILESATGVKILFLTTNDTDIVIQQALEIGARGFVLKTDPAADLLSAVGALENDQTFFTAKVEHILVEGFLNKRCIPATSTPRLTPQERRIAELVAEGKTTNDLAILLNVSPKSAECQRANMMHRLGCRSVAELVCYCIRNEVIELYPTQGVLDPRRWKLGFLTTRQRRATATIGQV